MTEPSAAAAPPVAFGEASLVRDAAVGVAWRELAGLLVAGLLVGFLLWPAWTLVPEVGLDPSWHVGLSLASSMQLQWGPDILFTWGPLSGLEHPLAGDRGQVIAASLVWLVTAVALVGATYLLVRVRFQRHMLATAAAAAVVVLILAIVQAPSIDHDLLAAAIVGSGVIAARRSLPAVVFTGVVAGVLGQAKVSDAAIAFGLAAFVTLGARGPRGVGVLVTATGAAFAATWLITGQALGNLPAYLTGIVPIVTSYPLAMGYEQASLVWQYPVAAVLVVGVMATAWLATKTWARTRRTATLGGVGFALWFSGHEGFVRHDTHADFFFAMVAALALVVALAATSRASLRLGVVTAVAGVLTLLATRGGPATLVEHFASGAALSRTVHTVIDPSYAAGLAADGRSRIAAADRITPELRAAVGSGPALIDPWEVTAITATDATWDPVPVFQDLLAYSPELDALNASDLAAGPRTVLRSVPYRAIDGRNPAWESPRFQRLIYCDYGVTFSTLEWQVLQPGAGSLRCAAPEPAEPAAARPETVPANQPVPVPRRDGAITLVTITPHQGVLGRAVELLAKPRSIFVTYGGATWRLAENPSAVELMLNAPVAHAAFPGLPALPQPEISVSRDATVTFEFVPVTSGGG